MIRAQPLLRRLAGASRGLQQREFADSAAVKSILDSVKLSSGDVLLQNEADSELGKAIIAAAKQRGVTTVNIIGDKPGSTDTVEALKRLGGDIVFTQSYANLWYVKRLLSDLPAPSVALNFSTGPQATAVAQLLKEGGTLLSYKVKLPENVPYAGASRRPMPWSTYLKSKKVTAKTL